MLEIPEFLNDLINAGIEITILKNDSLGVHFDLNLRAKSHMYLFKRDDKWFVEMRYDEEFEVEDVDDLKRLAEHGKHGRDFINPAWAEFLLDDETKVKRKLAQDALAILTPEQQKAVMDYLK